MFSTLILFFVVLKRINSEQLNSLTSRYDEVNYNSELWRLLSDMIDNMEEQAICFTTFVNRYYYFSISDDYYASRLFAQKPFFKISVNDSEDLLSPNYATVKMLQSVKKIGCNLYIILLTNGDQLGRLLTFGDRYRTIDTRAYYILLYDRRLFTKKYRFLWKKIVNVIFIHKHREGASTRFHISTVPFPTATSKIVTSRTTNTWKNGHFQKNPKLFYKTSNLGGELIKVATQENIPGIAITNQLVIKNEQNETKLLNIYGGPEIEFLKVLANAMNFRYSIYEPQNVLTERWGRRQLNDSFSGIIGELLDGRADMALGNLYYTPYHLQMFDLSNPYNTECLTFLTAESIMDNSWQTLILPFQRSMWFSVIVTLFIGGFSFYLLARYHSNRFLRNKNGSITRTHQNFLSSRTESMKNNLFRKISEKLEIIKKRHRIYPPKRLKKIDKPSTMKFSKVTSIYNINPTNRAQPKLQNSLLNRLLRTLRTEEDEHTANGKGLYVFQHFTNSILYTYGTLVAVSLPRIPSAWSIRLLTGWWLFFCILVAVAYRASLTAILAQPAPRLTIDTLEELADNKKIKCGGWNEEDKDFFITSLDTASQKVGDKFEVITDSIDTILERIENGLFAYYDNVHYLQYLMVKRKGCTMAGCNGTEGPVHIGRRQNRILHIMKKCVINMPISIGIQKNSPLKPAIDKILSMVTEAGLVQKWLDDIMFKVRNVDDRSSQTKALMSLNKLYGALVILVGGYVIGSIILIIELIVWKQYNQRKKKRRTKRY